MKVLIDEKIPFIRQAAECLFDEVAYLPGDGFAGSAELADADALVIRTRTRCDGSLLSGSRVRFVATATIGFDHIDTAFMRRAGIGWANCPGCNAASVAQYVRNAILELTQPLSPYPSLRGEGASPVTGVRQGAGGLLVGIVGYGHVGREVRKAVEAIGCEVLLNDPPLVEGGASPACFVSLETIARRCDVITFHTPLTAGGSHPTFHLADDSFFGSLGRRPVIVNAARGGVVDERALLRAFDRGLVGAMVIDTWEGEPVIDRELLARSFIATPHIAGYSADGKCNATRMALQAVCRHFGITIGDRERFLALTAPPPLPPEMQPCGDPVRDALALYDPLADTARLKAEPSAFEALRGDYPVRRESF